MTSRRIRLIGLTLVLALGLVGAQLMAQNPPGPPQARVDISGDWQVVTHEDQPNYAPGPELGDYAGMPINEAARQKAESWDAQVLSQQERQTQTHPVQYVGNNRGPARITKIIEPVTQDTLGYAFAGGFGRADRIIWTDGRPHPSEFSEHTWSGYSTGTWQDGTFVITTTHMKVGTTRRNGVYTSPYAKMVEYYNRTGTEIQVMVWIDDPLTQEEPMIRTYTLRWNPAGNTAAGNVFESVDEFGDKPAGFVPFWPLGTKQQEYAERFKIPFEATQGGADKLYPEYQIRLQELMSQQPQPAAR
jgi:hypothetical protein